MRIVDPSASMDPVQPGRGIATQSLNPEGSPAAGCAKGSSAVDRIQLSRFAGEVSESLQTSSASRARKVSGIAAAVKSGTYKVDSKAVSRSIVEHAIAGREDEDGEGEDQ